MAERIRHKLLSGEYPRSHIFFPLIRELRKYKIRYLIKNEFVVGILHLLARYPHASVAVYLFIFIIFLVLIFLWPVGHCSTN